ncbi:MAG: IS30 family transposase [Nitriliruptoraceae bacterium]
MAQSVKAAKRWQRLPREAEREIIRLARRGATYRQIQARLGVFPGTITRVLAPLGGVVRSDTLRAWGSRSRLSLDDRIEICLGLERGWSLRRIGRHIARHASSVSRELARNGGRQGYVPLRAHERAWREARRPKATKLATHPWLRRRVVYELERLWSPEQIARRLRREFGDQEALSISHETIYTSLYVQGRGELRRELARCLRTGRAQRKNRNRRERRGTIKDMVLISERPPEIEDRAVPGHWEGDLILGKQGTSAIGTLVERTTRFVLLLHLPKGRSASQVRDAMAAQIAHLPGQVRRSITWDQGSELAQHARFTLETNIPVYFCDPHAPWQRGTNENTNGLLRQYFPKGTDLSVHSAEHLQHVADELNQRPRKTLDFMTPSERLAELLVAPTD